MPAPLLRQQNAALRQEIEQAAPMLDGLATACSGFGHRAAWEIDEAEEGEENAGAPYVTVTTLARASWHGTDVVVIIECAEGWRASHGCTPIAGPFQQITQAIEAAVAFAASGREA